MSTYYTYTGTFDEFGGTVEFSFILTTTGAPSSSITGVGGSITYSNTTPYTTTSNIDIINVNAFEGNDNILSSSGQPYFTEGGLSVTDNTNNIQYNIYNNSGEEDLVINSINLGDGDPYEEGTEQLTPGCLLNTTQILTPEGYKLISEIGANDFIISENGRKIKVKSNIFSIIDNHDMENFPYRIPKGELNAIEDVYLSKGHAIKVNGDFKSPSQLGFKKQTLEELAQNGIAKIAYHHLELECHMNENRRTNTLIANGVIVESFSTELL